MKKSAILLFGVAAVLALGWGVLEGVLYLTSRPAPDCEIVEEFERPHETFLGTSAEGLWVGQPATESVSLLRVPAGDSRLGDVAVARTMSLRCETPGYGCFSTVENGGSKTLHPFFMQNGLILVRDDFGTVTPVLFGAKSRRAPAIRLCGQAPSSETRFFFWNSRLIAFDAASGRMGLWAMSSFPGTTNGDPGREPDELWKIAPPVGLGPATCGDMPSSGADVTLTGNRLFVLFSPPGEGTRLVSFVMDPALRPDPEWKDPFKGPNRIWRAGERRLVVASAAKEKLQILTFDEQGVMQPVQDSSARTPALPLVDVVEGAAGRDLIAAAGRFFHPVHLDLASRESDWALASLDMTWRRSRLPAQGWISRGDDRGVWARQSADGVKLTAFRCRPKSERGQHDSQ